MPERPILGRGVVLRQKSEETKEAFLKCDREERGDKELFWYKA